MAEVVIFCSLSQSITVDELLKEEFQLFQLQYGRNYQSQSEYQFRMNIYIENRMMIASHNQKYHQGISTFSMEINRFADRSDEELFGMGDKYIPNNEFPRIKVKNSSLADIPDELDWRDHPGYVNPVKDQGDYCSKIGCKTNYEGNALTEALVYQRENGGIASEKDYPYTGKEEKCYYNPVMRVLEVSASAVIGPFNEEMAMVSTAFFGPLYAAIDGQQKSFTFYKEGIYKDDNCKNKPKEMNFVVLIVGYGIDKTTGQKYWIVKNSWGTKWGEDGYIRLDRTGYLSPVIDVMLLKCKGEWERPLALSLSQSINVDELLKEEFQLFQLQYGRNYQSQSEYQFRMNIYLENRMMIASHNQKYHQGISTFSMEINRFADRSDEELLGMGNKKNIPNNEIPRIQATNSSLADIPDELDWRDHPGYVNPVRDQGDCKSAWAFAFAAIVESHHFIAKNESVVVSVQELLDCTNISCNINYGFYALVYVYMYQGENSGIASEKNYPYTGKYMRVLEITGMEVFNPITEEHAMNLTAINGPVFAPIDGQQKSFIFYKKGIYKDDNCKNKPEDMNFAVLIVGYGIDKTTGQKYWIVKNSLGAQWGEDGYMRMDRSGNNQCGINNRITLISNEHS
ncbi:hypothetical protein CHUAL_011328 [Chamberlinius hualienensis]